MRRARFLQLEIGWSRHFVLVELIIVFAWRTLYNYLNVRTDLALLDFFPDILIEHSFLSQDYSNSHICDNAAFVATSLLIENKANLFMNYESMYVSIINLFKFSFVVCFFSLCPSYGSIPFERNASGMRPIWGHTI